jgi:hypothetical protein
MVTETSKQAYQAEREKLTPLCAEVLDIIELFYNVMSRWPTNREIMVSLNIGDGRHWSPADVSARRNDLINAGLVEPTDTIKCTYTNRTVHTWKIRFITTH